MNIINPYRFKIKKLQNSLLFNGVDKYMETAQANIDVNLIAGSAKEFAFVVTFIGNTLGDLFSVYNSIGNRLFSINWNGDRVLYYTYLNSGDGLKRILANTGSSPASVWQHVVINVRYNTLVGQIYVNSVDQTATNQITSAVYGSGAYGNWRIGEGRGQFHDGNIGQIALIKRNLTPTEITNLYNGGCPRLVGDIISAADIEFKLEDNYSWNGSNIVGTDSMTSVNMVEADITTTTPC